MEAPLPSPTMPPLEDATAKSERREIDAAKTLLPVEIRAKTGRNLPQIDQHTVPPVGKTLTTLTVTKN